MITVNYWRGTTQCTAEASGYAEAMRIADRNQNAFDPTFYETGSGRKLIDDGNGLAYEDEADQGRTLYAVRRRFGAFCAIYGCDE